MMFSKMSGSGWSTYLGLLQCVAVPVNCPGRCYCPGSCYSQSLSSQNTTLLQNSSNSIEISHTGSNVLDRNRRDADMTRSEWPGNRSKRPESNTTP